MQENRPQEVNIVAVNNNKTWIEWIGAWLSWFMYATIKFVPFYTFLHFKRRIYTYFSYIFIIFWKFFN
jgi:hypothetical protein